MLDSTSPPFLFSLNIMLALQGQLSLHINFKLSVLTSIKQLTGILIENIKIIEQFYIFFFGHAKFLKWCTHHLLTVHLTSNQLHVRCLRTASGLGELEDYGLLPRKILISTHPPKFFRGLMNSLKLPWTSCDKLISNCHTYITKLTIFLMVSFGSYINCLKRKF